MSYSRETLRSFSTALAALYAAGAAAPLTRFLPPAARLSDDDAFLVELFASHVASLTDGQARQTTGAAKSTTAAPDAADFSRLRALGLTLRECEVVCWIAQGKRDAEIAAVLGCAPKTVSKHVENVLAKLGTETRLAAACTARDWLQRVG